MLFLFIPVYGFNAVKCVSTCYNEAASKMSLSPHFLRFKATLEYIRKVRVQLQEYRICLFHKNYVYFCH